MRRTKVMTQDRLEKLLRSLPALDEYCSGKGIVEKLKLSPEPLIVPLTMPLTMPCTHKAILRDPGSGAYFCADCAIDWAKLHSFRKECMELAVRERRFFIEHPCAECASCAQPPHRRCSFCVTSLCYECMVFIPSKGCACPTCSAWLEAEAQEAEEVDGKAMASTFFASPEHRQRFLNATQQIGKVYNGKIDAEYGAALYILTSSTGTWNKASDYVSRRGIRFEALLSEVDFSSGYLTLIRLAANLFNELSEEGQKIRPVDFMELDERNFQVALTALQIRRVSLAIKNIEGARE